MSRTLSLTWTSVLMLKRKSLQRLKMLLLRLLPRLAPLLLRNLSLRSFLKALVVFLALKKKLKKSRRLLRISQTVVAISALARITVVRKTIVVLNVMLTTRASARLNALLVTRKILTALLAINLQTHAIVMIQTRSLSRVIIVTAMLNAITTISATMTSVMSAQRRSQKLNQVLLMITRRKHHVAHATMANVVAIARNVLATTMKRIRLKQLFQMTAL